MIVAVRVCTLWRVLKEIWERERELSPLFQRRCKKPTSLSLSSFFSLLNSPISSTVFLLLLL
ncbi:unnamed protein product, partial [Vitis vinifera]